ncbi:MAG: nicotinate-nucleotide pyrophosphorylase [Methanosarcinaceae archaeon]|nr:nicotinate-nucleotide pyrophosphorylase [Methanosarcinaceae archaeon]
MLDFFDLYLFEDCPYGDETTEILGVKGNGTLRILSREYGVAACSDDLEAFYKKKGLNVTGYIENGKEFGSGDTIFEAEGNLKELFKLWRISQTFLSMVCSIAAKTKIMVDSAKKVNPDVILATSRKTHPGFRKYELKAVRAGGGDHHRNSLSDSILITQNHFNIVGSFGKLSSMKKIEIEPRTREELFKYAGIADVLLLDHYKAEELETLVPALKSINPKLEVAIGGIDVKNIPEYARFVDVIVTTAPYYAKPLDLTTKIEKMEKF